MSHTNLVSISLRVARCPNNDEPVTYPALGASA
jgi:hypothetical protein